MCIRDSIRADQLRRKFDILAAAADSNGKLVFGNNNLNPVIFFVKYHLAYLCRRQGADDKLCLIGRIRHNINFFTLKFGYNLSLIHISNIKGYDKKSGYRLRNKD